MNKKLLAAVAAAGALSLLGFAPNAHAACDSGTSQVRDAEGNPTGEDTVTTTPNGSTIYGAQDANATAGGYVGITGSNGYVELAGADGDATVQGSTSDGSVNGAVGTGGVCVNDTSAP